MGLAPILVAAPKIGAISTCRGDRRERRELAEYFGVGNSMSSLVTRRTTRNYSVVGNYDDSRCTRSRLPCWFSALWCRASCRLLSNALLNVGPLERARRQRDDGASISNQYRLKVQGDDPWSDTPGDQIRGERQPRQTGDDLHVTPGTTHSALTHPSRSLGASESHAATRQRSDTNGLLQQLLVRLAAAIEQGNIQVALLDLLRGLIEQTHVDPLMQASIASNRSHTEFGENSTRAMKTIEISHAFAGDPVPHLVAGNHYREIQSSPQLDSSKATSTTNSDEPPAATHTDGTLRRQPLFPELARVIG